MSSAPPPTAPGGELAATTRNRVTTFLSQIGIGPAVGLDHDIRASYVSYIRRTFNIGLVTRSEPEVTP
jgi:hypothetical protein